ncbi:hypothetical protein EV383_2364 [Pseudonocardia sediminis]|uniref:Uncharacterized protein n=1 Tax=Pseudonocardia sediminis TaxID=1397368 RepID=A0A4Q7UU82_PSEST|nr:hypothetical protein [Pseudonocardia sediminis]RZT85497.1 hypothetical protein EV383_2364 [Pseudonocardia sediminis]
MWKHTVVATAARAFSVNDLTRSAHRRPGNVVLGRMRDADGLPDRYVERAKDLVRTCETHRILRPGDRFDGSAFTLR